MSRNLITQSRRDRFREYINKWQLFNISQLHGYPTRSKPSERRTNSGTSSSCNFAEEVLKVHNDLVGKFYDLRNEIINVKYFIVIQSNLEKTLN